MKPLKMYVDKTAKSYKRLVNALTREKSVLGSNVDDEGFHLIIDYDNSKIIQARYNSDGSRIGKPCEYGCGGWMRICPTIHPHHHICEKCGRVGG